MSPRRTHVISRLVTAVALVLGMAAVLPGPSVAADTEDDYGRMLLVLDSSGSMAEQTGGGTTKIKAAKTALTRVVGDLPPDSAVGLRVYGATVFSKRQKGACTDSQLVVPLGTDNRAELTRAIAGFKPYGETPIAHALQEAAKDIGSEGKRAIVLVSDGIATCEPDPCEVAADLSAAGIDLQIDVIGLGVSGGARDQLQCIADRGNGTYYNVDSADEIADTLTRVSQRAVRPFTLSGSPVEGTPTADGAPTLTAGQWTDHLGGKGTPEAVRHYRVERSIPNSTIHVVATTRGTLGEWDEVSVSLTDELGAECDTAQDSRNVDQYAILAAQAMAGRDKQYVEDACWQGDRLGLVVERGRFEDTERAPMSITVFEEPPAQGVESLPEYWDASEYVAPRVTGPAEPLTAGTSFEDAPRITSGLYELDIVPGESQIVKVPLDWGQQFTMRAIFPAGTPGVRELTGVQGPFADVKMYSSLTGAMSGAYVGTDSNTILPGSGPGELSAMSPEVRYRNRQVYGDINAYLPGDYFVVISANASHDGDSWVQPYKLAVEILGEPGGAPSYKAAPTEAPSEEPAADRGKDKAEAPAADAGDDEAGLSLAGASGIAIVILGAVAAAFLLGRRSKPRA